VKALTAFLAGAIFGAGLLLSGMTNPANVLGFLDLFGAWRPQLALVMAAAIAVAAPAFLLIRRRQRDLRGEPVELPRRSGVDSRLLAGAAIFGVGWGLSGICPGPGVVLLASGKPLVIVFVAALLAGSWAASAAASASVESAAPGCAVD